MQEVDRKEAAPQGTTERAGMPQEMQHFDSTALNVILDISVLGLGVTNSLFRTGIYRVVENLALELTRLDGIDLKFSAIKLPGLAKRYRLTQSMMAPVPLAIPRSRLILSSVLGSLISAEQERSPSPRRLTDGCWMAYVLADALIGKLLPPIDGSSLKTPSIFHSTMPFYQIPKQVRRTRGVSVFVTAYDLTPILYPEYVGNRLRVRLEKALHSLCSSDWVLCISEATRNDLLNYCGNLDPERVLVTHLAASSRFRNVADDLELARVRSRYKIPDGPYFFSLCNLAPHKNLGHIVKSFALMAQQENELNASLVLAGAKGWQYENIFDAIREARGLEERIIVTGYVEDSDLPALYSGATAFVYMSRYEGFGLPCLEAMCCGIPVISSNTSSMPEVIGDAGIMISPDDSDALAQAMLGILYNGTWRQALREKAFRRSLQFSWSKCAQETMHAYQAAIQST